MTVDSVYLLDVLWKPGGEFFRWGEPNLSDRLADFGFRLRFRLNIRILLFIVGCWLVVIGRGIFMLRKGFDDMVC
jgi:hypothetical protein